MNKGTGEGVEEEVLLTKKLNQKKDKNLWLVLGLSSDNNFAIRVISKKYGKINNEKIFPKTDVFIATGMVDEKYLFQKKFYLDEKDLFDFGLTPLNNSGISVKRSDSKNYQIMKMAPSTFLKVFGSNLLAAGASVYCLDKNEFIKNEQVLKGWGVSEVEFISFFNEKIKIPINSVTDKNNQTQLEEIKRYCNNAIKEKIQLNDKISQLIFWGNGNFEEPYVASWLFERGELKRNFAIPFNVTTGSGRTKGDFTIVIKPKN